MKLVKQLIITSLATVLITGSGIGASAGLYRWVDSTGQVHYSDTPQPGAEEITLRSSNVSQSFKTSASSSSSSDTVENTFAGYSSVVVNSPQADEVLWNTGGQINITLSTQPKLRKGDGYVVYLDGKAINSQPQTSPSFTVSDVFRGTHTVRGAVVSNNGDILLNGPAVTFHVRQNSIIRSR